MGGAAPPKEEAKGADTAQQVAPTAAPTVNYAPYSDKYSERCYEAKNHDSADLCAQWRAAIAAEKSADTAGWGVRVDGVSAALAFISIVLVFFALMQGRTANRISRRHSHTDLRPYVYVERIVLDASEPMPGLIGQVGDVTLHIKNFGRTPAKNVVLTAQAKVGGYWSDQPPAVDHEATLVHLGDIPPDVAVPQDGYYAHDLATNKIYIENATASVFVWGKITYKDASGAAYETNFRRASTGDNFHARKFSTCPEGNAAT